MRMLRMRAPVALVAVIVLIAASACGSSTKPSAASGGTTATTATSAVGATSCAHPTGTPIVIGSIHPVGTVEQNDPDVVAAIRAGARGVNCHGGIDGHPVTVDWCNEGGSPNTASACARKMANKPRGRLGQRLELNRRHRDDSGPQPGRRR